MMRQNMPGLVLMLGFALGAASVQAQDELVYDRVDLTANATAEVQNDVLIAVVFAEVEDNDQADAADAVNEAIGWAARRARGVDGIDVQTQNYSTRPLYANGRRIVGWAARQSMRLESQDAEALSSLLGELQERVAIQSISYAVSPEAQDAAEEALIAEALARFDRRARLIARELGRPGFRIVRINVNTPFGNPTFFMNAARAESLAVAPPEIEAGTQNLQVTVNGQIELDAAQ